MKSGKCFLMAKNTILFENQRLNQNMIDLLKRCEKLEDEIVGKYEDIFILRKNSNTFRDVSLYMYLIHGVFLIFLPI